MKLVYILGLKGPEPQKWFDDMCNGAGKTKPTLQSNVVDEKFTELTLEQLVAIYPYKGAPSV
jgi:hypothetical protein